MKEKLQKYSRQIAIVLMVILMFLGIGALALKNHYDEKNENETAEKETTKESEDKKEDEESESTPLLYKVTKEGTDTTMYLFGSIHVADDRAYPLPKQVMEAYNNSEYLAVEFDIITYSKDYKEQIDSLQSLVLKDGTTVKDHLSAKTYELMIEYLKEKDLYNSMYDYYKPAIHYSLISNIQTEMSKLDTDLGIDMYFLEKAHKENKKILEVESASSQYEVLSSLPDELYDFLILSSILEEDTMVKESVDLYEAWLKGDSQYILDISEDDTEILEKYNSFKDLSKLLDEYDKALIDDRNKLMTEKAIQYFNEGKDVFYVVGMAHIVGDDAIADSLEKAGYKVEIVEY